MSRVGAKRHLPAAAAALVAGALGAGLAHGAGVSPRPVGFSAFLLTSCKRPETSAGARRVSRVLRAARGRRGAAAPGGRRLVLGFPLSSPSGALRTGTVGVCPRPRVLHARAPPPLLARTWASVCWQKSRAPESSASGVTSVNKWAPHRGRQRP